MSHWALKRRQSSEALKEVFVVLFWQDSCPKRLLSGCRRDSVDWRATREPCRGQGNGDDDGH